MDWRDEAQKNYNTAVQHAEKGNWDHALDAAKKVPANWDVYQRFPEFNIPPEHIDKVLSQVPKSDHGNFMYELSNNLHPDLKHENLKRIGEMSLNDQYVHENIQGHPNWAPSPEEQGHLAASEFWRSYEKKVRPEHFASIKSMYTGKPETIKDHRGNIGGSNSPAYMHEGTLHSKDSLNMYSMTNPQKREDIIKQGIPLTDAHPHLQSHAKKVQDAVMKDKFIKKKFVGDKAYVQVHRGVSGDYGKKIHKVSGIDHADFSVHNKTLNVPTAHMTSWSTDLEMAKRFAAGRGHIPGQEGQNGVVMSSWQPVENILHSGSHTVHVGQEHAHSSENELVIGHPEGKVKVSTKQMHFQRQDHPGYTESMQKPEVKPKPFAKTKFEPS